LKAPSARHFSGEYSVSPFLTRNLIDIRQYLRPEARRYSHYPYIPALVRVCSLDSQPHLNIYYVIWLAVYTSLVLSCLVISPVSVLFTCFPAFKLILVATLPVGENFNQLVLVPF
jgi:hypothetical protein